MKLLVFSDSHGVYAVMRDTVLQEQPDTILHLGDGAREAQRLAREFPAIPVTALTGNCDRGAGDAAQFLDELGGVRIFACHGDRYQVKSTLLHLFYAAEERQASLCLYGHTHIARCETLRGIQFFNPGSCGGIRPSCGVVELDGGCAQCRILQLHHKEEA